MRCPVPPRHSRTAPQHLSPTPRNTGAWEPQQSIFFVLDAFQKSKTFYVALTIACNSLFHFAVGYDQGSSVAPFTSKAVNMRADSTSDMDNG